MDKHEDQRLREAGLAAEEKRYVRQVVARHQRRAQILILGAILAVSSFALGVGGLRSTYWLIDSEQASAPTGTGVTGQNRLWVKSSNHHFIHTNSSNVDFDVTAAAVGVGSLSGIYTNGANQSDSTLTLDNTRHGVLVDFTSLTGSNPAFRVFNGSGKNFAIQNGAIYGTGCASVTQCIQLYGGDATGELDVEVNIQDAQTDTLPAGNLVFNAQKAYTGGTLGLTASAGSTFLESGSGGGTGAGVNGDVVLCSGTDCWTGFPSLNAPYFRLGTPATIAPGAAAANGMRLIAANTIIMQNAGAAVGQDIVQFTGQNDADIKMKLTRSTTKPLTLFGSSEEADSTGPLIISGTKYTGGVDNFGCGVTFDSTNISGNAWSFISYGNLVATGAFALRQGGASKFNIWANGNMDIGSTLADPGFLLRVEGTGDFTGALTFGGGALATGSSTFDLSGSSGTEKTTTGALTIGASSTTITNKITSYNGEATDGVGATYLRKVAQSVASVGGATTIATLTSPATGLYRVAIQANAHTNNDTVSSTITYTDADEAFATTLACFTSVALVHDSNTGTTSCTQLIRASAASSIVCNLSASTQTTTHASCTIERQN